MVYDMQRCSTWGIQSWEDGDEAQKLVGQHGAAHIQSNAPFATKDWMRWWEICSDCFSLKLQTWLNLNHAVCGCNKIPNKKAGFGYVDNILDGRAITGQKNNEWVQIIYCKHLHRICFWKYIYIFLILWLLFNTSFYQTNCMSALSCIYHKACCNHYVIYIKWIHGDRSKTITHYLILKRMNIPQSMRNPTNYSISPPKSYEIPTKSPPKYHKNPPDLILLKSAPDGTSRHCLVIAHRCQFPLVLARAWRGPFGWHGQLGIEWCGT